VTGFVQTRYTEQSGGTSRWGRALLIKSADDKQRDIEALTVLLTRSDLTASTRQKIEREIRFVRAGLAGERAAAYEIDFHYGDSTKKVVIHDLRIEIEGRVAQIDHLVLNRLLDLWVLETKHFAGGVGVNEQGEWVSYWNGKARGIPSPVEQNRRHMAVLKEAFDKGIVRVPKRLGIKLKPELRSLILVSTSARISRPRSKAAQSRVDGLDSVTKTDQFATTIEKMIDDESAVRALGSLSRLVSSETLQDIGWQLVALHKPSHVDWAARFGLGPVSSVSPSVESPGIPAATPAPGRSCASCGFPVSVKAVAYCEANESRFGGRILCFNCQRVA